VSGTLSVNEVLSTSETIKSRERLTDQTRCNRSTLGLGDSIESLLQVGQRLIQLGLCIEMQAEKRYWP
jgi:hypothetical protein